MFGSNKKKEEVNTNRIDSLIGEGTIIQGDIQFQGGLRMEGKIIGNVQIGDVPGVLMLGPKGEVEGDIQVTHLIVDGTIRGSIHAENMVELRPTARVLGNIHYGALEIHPGAVFEGHMVSHKIPLLSALSAPNATPESLPSPTEITAEA